MISFINNNFRNGGGKSKKENKIGQQKKLGENIEFFPSFIAF
jgi:hypothetical protein